MITKENVEEILNNGGHLVGADDHKIGSIGQFYVDDDSGRPSWVTVKTGLFGTSESFVPLSEATVDGHDVRVPYDKDTVKDAPRMEADSQLSPEEEDRLYQHYGSAGARDTSTDNDAHSAAAGTHSGVTTGTDDMRGERTGTHLGDDGLGDTDRDDGLGNADRDDEAMTRSEEELHVGTEKQETGRARLRKYVVTENVETTVPVSHEEVRVEREPITDANRGQASTGAEFSEEEHEVTLSEERPVVEKDTVPVERVRLDKETVTEEAHVDEEVRKEQVEAEGVDNDGRDNR